MLHLYSTLLSTRLLSHFTWQTATVEFKRKNNTRVYWKNFSGLFNRVKTNVKWKSTYGNCSSCKEVRHVFKKRKVHLNICFWFMSLVPYFTRWIFLERGVSLTFWKNKARLPVRYVHHDLAVFWKQYDGSRVRKEKLKEKKTGRKCNRKLRLHPAVTVYSTYLHVERRFLIYDINLRFVVWTNLRPTEMLKMYIVAWNVFQTAASLKRKYLGSLRFHYTRVGTLIVATIYLQLIQNRYMSWSFTVLQCSHLHCVQPVASDVEVVGYL